MIVGTAADQIAVVSAPLRRSWTENGRRYFHYGTDVADRFERLRLLGEVRSGRGSVA